MHSRMQAPSLLEHSGLNTHSRAARLAMAATSPLQDPEESMDGNDDGSHVPGSASQSVRRLSAGPGTEPPSRAASPLPTTREGALSRRSFEQPEPSSPLGRQASSDASPAGDPLMRAAAPASGADPTVAAAADADGVASLEREEMRQQDSNRAGSPTQIREDASTGELATVPAGPSSVKSREAPARSAQRPPLAKGPDGSLERQPSSSSIAEQVAQRITTPSATASTSAAALSASPASPLPQPPSSSALLSVRDTEGAHAASVGPTSTSGRTQSIPESSGRGSVRGAGMLPPSGRGETPLLSTLRDRMLSNASSRSGIVADSRRGSENGAVDKLAPSERGGKPRDRDASGTPSLGIRRKPLLSELAPKARAGSRWKMAVRQITAMDRIIREVRWAAGPGNELGLQMASAVLVLGCSQGALHDPE